MYHMIIKHFGRVPDCDGKMARRIKGPGLSMEYYQVIKADLPILMIQYQLEKEQIAFYKNEMTALINQPCQQFQQYLSGFQSVGLSGPCTNFELWTKFQETQKRLTKQLDDQISQHFNRLLFKGMSSVSRTSKVRLTKNDLHYVTVVGTNLCEKFCVFMAEKIGQNWWTSKGLVPQDYVGLTMVLLKQSFGDTIAQPLEDIDQAGFRIDVIHNNFSNYATKFYSGTQESFENCEQSQFIDPTIVVAKYPSTPDIVVVTPENLSDTTESEERFIRLT
jgi:hypothetical protein